MLTHRSKRTFYRFAGPLMRFNGLLYWAFRAPREGHVRVQLGPGQKNYLEGWINLDANMFTGRCDVWADLRNPLPFRSNSIACIYSHHVVEHLPDIKSHFQEVMRCLIPGGVYRFGGPNGDAAIDAFVRNDARWFSDFPDRRASIGGRLENFIFCRQEHLTILTESYLRELLDATGFVAVARCLPVKETRFTDLFADCLKIEHESDWEHPHTLILEAVKPASSMDDRDLTESNGIPPRK
jgi:predicted SAM-dependent methyltransferase